MRPLYLTLVLAMSSISCGGSDLPPAQPVEVRVSNQSSASLYLAGDELSFRLQNALGRTWRPDAAFLPLCTRCDEACDSEITGDPVPLWIEVPAGETVPLDWDGRLYRTIESACDCGSSCAEVETFADGDYDLVLEFELALPDGWAPYTSVDQGDGIQRWRGSGLGTADPSQIRIYPIDYQGELSIRIDFTG